MLRSEAAQVARKHANRTLELFVIAEAEGIQDDSISLLKMLRFIELVRNADHARGIVGIVGVAGVVAIGLQDAKVEESRHQLTPAQRQGKRVGAARIVVVADELLQMRRLRVSREVSQIAERRQLPQLVWDWLWRICLDMGVGMVGGEIQRNRPGFDQFSQQSVEFVPWYVNST